MKCSRVLPKTNAQFNSIWENTSRNDFYGVTLAGYQVHLVDLFTNVLLVNETCGCNVPHSQKYGNVCRTIQPSYLASYKIFETLVNNLTRKNDNCVARHSNNGV